MEITAEAAAQSILNHFSEGGKVVLPVDPVEVARFLGINVYKTKLDNTLSGMIAKVSPQADTDIIVNSEQAPVRQRFTIAHELGHYFAIRSDPIRDGKPFIHRRAQLAACGTDSEEIFANGFAAQLLMPRNEVIDASRIGADAALLAPRFHVSLDAMTNRLRSLGLAK